MVTAICRWASLPRRLVPSNYFLSRRSLHTSSNLSLLLKNYMIPTVRVEQDIQAVAKSLEKKVGLAPLFYQNAPVVLDFEATEGKLESNNIVTLFNEIHKLNLIPVGITFTQDPVIQDLAKQYNIPFINSARASNKSFKQDDTNTPSSPVSPSPSHQNSQFAQQKTEKMQIRTFSNTIQTQQTTSNNINATNFNSQDTSFNQGFNLPTKDKTSSPIPPNPSSPSASPSFSTSYNSSPFSSASSSFDTPNTNNNNNSKTNEETSTPPLIIKASLRSGQQVYARNGADLIVMGSVHSGAEALADGSIHIYGALKGRALAGVSGNAEAKIFSGKFHAELISIGDTYCACEEQPPGTDPNKASVVWLEDGNLKFSTMD